MVLLGILLSSLFLQFFSEVWETRVWIPSKLKFFFQASFLKSLELPLACEGPLFTWMSFYDNLWFIYLKKKYTSLCRGKWGAREQNAMASGSAQPGCFVPESSALIVKLPPVSHTISFNLSISLSFLRTRNATPSFHVPSVISIWKIRTNLLVPSCALCSTPSYHYPSVEVRDQLTSKWFFFFNYWLSEFCTL